MFNPSVHSQSSVKPTFSSNINLQEYLSTGQNLFENLQK